jgi:hypothetical protein
VQGGHAHRFRDTFATELLLTGVPLERISILLGHHSISCCLPLGFAAALGAGAVSAFFVTLRPWLLGMSLVLIGFGFWQQHRAKQCAVGGQIGRQSIALGCCGCGLGNDSVSAANRWMGCGWIVTGWKMKKKLIVIAVVAAVVVLGAIYVLGGPGIVAAGQQPLTALTSTNAGAFEAAFDANADLPRLVLVLSPT